MRATAKEAPPIALTPAPRAAASAAPHPAPPHAPFVRKAEENEEETPSAPSAETIAALGPALAPCSFGAVNPKEGKTSRQCCGLEPGLDVCLDTMSLFHHHEVGPYTERTLRAIRRSDHRTIATLPLDRAVHFSMAHRDLVAVQLVPSIHRRGIHLELVEAARCQAACDADEPDPSACAAELRNVAKICESAGNYIWNGTTLILRRR